MKNLLRSGKRLGSVPKPRSEVRGMDGNSAIRDSPMLEVIPPLLYSYDNFIICGRGTHDAKVEH